MLLDVRKIWRATSVQSFEGQGGKFEPYTPFNMYLLISRSHQSKSMHKIKNKADDAI